jgi:hypothetical protein
MITAWPTFQMGTIFPIKRKVPSSGIQRYVVRWKSNDVTEEHAASIFRTSRSRYQHEARRKHIFSICIFLRVVSAVTHYLQRNSFRESDSRSAGQYISCHLWDHIHKIPPLDPFRSRTNPVLTLSAYAPEIDLNTVLLQSLGLSWVYLGFPFRFPY